MKIVGVLAVLLALTKKHAVMASENVHPEIYIHDEEYEEEEQNGERLIALPRAKTGSHGRHAHHQHPHPPAPLRLNTQANIPTDSEETKGVCKNPAHFALLIDGASSLELAAFLYGGSVAEAKASEAKADAKDVKTDAKEAKAAPVQKKKFSGVTATFALDTNKLRDEPDYVKNVAAQIASLNAFSLAIRFNPLLGGKDLEDEAKVAAELASQVKVFKERLPGVSLKLVLLPYNAPKAAEEAVRKANLHSIPHNLYIDSKKDPSKPLDALSVVSNSAKQSFIALFEGYHGKIQKDREGHFIAPPVASLLAQTVNRAHQLKFKFVSVEECLGLGKPQLAALMAVNDGKNNATEGKPEEESSNWGWWLLLGVVLVGAVIGFIMYRNRSEDE